MKIAIYCRVSTDDKGQDPEVQLFRCRDYCKLHEHIILGEFLDEGVSGDTNYQDRPGGKHLHNLIHKNKIDGIVVFSIDRFSRQSPLKVMQTLNHFKDRGLKFISITEPIFNMESEFAEPMRFMLTWFSSYFLKQHKTKVKAGMKKARKYGTKSGKPIGRKRKADYDKIKEVYGKLGSISATARELDVSKSSVSHAINGSKRSLYEHA